MPDKTIRVRLEALTAGYQAKLAQASATTKAFGNNVVTTADKHKAAFNTIGLGAASMGAAVAYGFYRAIHAAMDFESSFAGVRKTVDASEAEFSAMAEGMLDLADKIPVAVDELNAIGESAGQLGVRKGAILGFTETVAKLGVTTDLAGEQGATGLARIANIMGTSQRNFDRMGSTIVALGNAGASTESEIVEMALRIAGAGKQVGMSEAEVLGFANALSSVGIAADAGGSSISRTFINIASAVDKGGEKLETFARVAGMATGDFARLFQRDAARATVKFIEGLNRVKEEGGSVFQILDKLGLSEIRVRDALLRASGAGDLFRQSLELGSEAWKENNALNAEAEKRFETTASQAQLAANHIHRLAIDLGDMLLPAFNSFLGLAERGVDVLGDLPGPLKEIAAGLGGVAAAAGIVGGAFLLLAPRITDVKKLIAESALAQKISLGIASAEVAILAASYYGLKGAVEAAADGIMTLTNQTRSVPGLLGAGKGATQEEAAMVEENKDAMHDLAEEMAGVGASGDIVWEKLELVRKALFDLGIGITNTEPDDFRRALQEVGSQLGFTASSTSDNKAAADELAQSWDDVASSMEETKSLAEQLTDALDELTGGAITTERTSVSWLNSLQALRGEIKDNGASLDKYTQKGRDNRTALQNSIDAAFEHAKAISEETGSLKRGRKTFQDHITDLMGVAEETGISRDQVRAYLDELNLTPKDVRTLLVLSGVEKSRGDLDDIKRKLHELDGFTAQATVGIFRRTTGPGAGTPLMHGGGVAGSHGARRYGSGRLRGDEIPAILRRGELVTAGHGAGGPVTHISVAVDARGATDPQAVGDAAREGVYEAVDQHAKRVARHNRARRVG